MICQYLEEKLENGKSIVFLWKKGVDIKNAQYNLIKEDMENIFDKANIIKSK